MKHDKNLEIRSATAEESGDIRRLILEGGINPFGLDWRRFVVAVTGEGDVIGCGQLKPHGKDTLEMASLAVTEDWRGEGIGRRLIEELLQRGSEPLWLMCRSSLVPLYQKFGFEEVGPGEEQPKYFQRMRRLVEVLNTAIGRDEYLAVMVRR